MKTNPKSRRQFLLESTRVGVAASAAALALRQPVAAQGAASAAQTLGANERLRVALIGCGGMGRSDLRDFLRVKNVQCVALCDVDDEQSAKAAKQMQNVGAAPAEFVTKDFRRVLDRRDVDAVIIATPDHWHALPAVMACQAGKDAYVEKPLATSIGEGRIMVDEARRHNRVVQMGTQQRSASHYTQAVNYVKSGQLGKIRLVRAWAYLDWKGAVPKEPDAAAAPAGVDYDLWLGPAPRRQFNPNRFHFNFRWYWDYSGGLMTDWGAHMIDIANWAMGIKAPTSAVSIGGKYGFPDDAMETPDTQQVLWQFPDFSMVWEHAVGVGRGPEAREHGVAFHGNNGVLVVDRGGWEVYAETERRGSKPRAYKAPGVPRVESGDEDYHLRHVQNFVDCVKTRERPASDVEIGHNSMIACHLGNIAYRLGRQVKWDVERERTVDDEQAQKYVMRDYRAPWKLTS